MVSFWMRGIALLLLLCRAWGDGLVYGAVPLLEEVMRVEHVIAADRRWSRRCVLPLHDRKAVLAADAARETHDERVRLGGDATNRAALQPCAAVRALHRADALEDRADPIHR